MNASQRHRELRREHDEIVERRERLLSERERLLRKATEAENDLMVAERKATRQLAQPDEPGQGEAKQAIVSGAKNLERLRPILKRRAERLLEELEEVREARRENAIARCENLLDNADELGLDKSDFRELASVYRGLTGEERLPPMGLRRSEDDTGPVDDWDPREAL